MPETTNVTSATEENLNQDCGCGCSSVGAGNNDCGGGCGGDSCGSNWEELNFVGEGQVTATGEHGAGQDCGCGCCSSAE